MNAAGTLIVLLVEDQDSLHLWRPGADQPGSDEWQVIRTAGATSAFGTAKWTKLTVPGAAGLATNNSIFNGASVGVAKVNGAVVSWGFGPALPN